MITKIEIIKIQFESNEKILAELRINEEELEFCYFEKALYHCIINRTK